MANVKLSGEEGTTEKEVFESQFSVSRGIFNFVKTGYSQAICYNMLIIIPHNPTTDLRICFAGKCHS